MTEFPYVSEKPCDVCQPHDPPKLEVTAHTHSLGRQVHRQLRCPNCDTTSADIFDTVTKRVSFDKQAENAAIFHRR
jgi:hypothetical protein